MGLTGNISEFQLETKLYVTRTGRASDNPSALRVYGYTRKTEVRMIEHIKKLSPKLKVQFLRERVSLNQGDIPLLNSRPCQDIAAGIPEARRTVC